MTLSLGSFAAVTYLVCMLYGLVVPQTLHMAAFLEVVLPGFHWLTPGAFVLGLVESLVYGATRGE